ncbi:MULTISPECIES: VOC family protein [Streptomyces]|uniref:VOC family protein n=1 Tax=Streptomyces TaxID=1883 RepID=UPI0004D874E4|nr:MULTISPECIES: VOC family protein [Streptomyces]
MAVASLATPTLTAQAADTRPSDTPRVQDNPSWGKELPPADAPTSRAYDLIVENNDKGYAPRSGECSKEIHARYWDYGPDGKVYPTWHPAKDAGGCTFGHIRVPGHGTSDERGARIKAESERLVAAGGTVLEEFEGHHVVMADPEGNEFCVAAAAPES